jgi:hypothetical protein
VGGIVQADADDLARVRHKRPKGEFVQRQGRAKPELGR